MMNIFQGQNPKDALVFHLSKVGGGFPLSRNFRLLELACRDGSDEVLVHPSLIILLQVIRDKFNRPVSVTSGYRTKAHNERVGGRSRSSHLLGMAADIVCKDVAPQDIQSFLQDLDIGGLGSYQTFTHLDVWTGGRRWSS